MAHPKRKTSKGRRDQRRASNYTLSAPTLVECPQCHEMKLTHRLCKSCGFYKGKEVIKVAE